mgnify:CR=1 FL=1
MTGDGTTMTGDGTRGAQDAPRLREAIAVGALAYLLGFSLLHLAGRVVNETPRGGASEPSPGVGVIAQGHEAAGAVLYGAHFVPVSPWSGWYSANALFDAGIALPESPISRVTWFLVPAVIVALSGFLLNERTDAPATRARTAIGRGSWITYGYLPPFLVGGLVMGVAPLLVLVVGVLYPVVLGGLGGFLYHIIGRRSQ